MKLSERVVELRHEGEWREVRIAELGKGDVIRYGGGVYEVVACEDWRLSLKSVVGEEDGDE